MTQSEARSRVMKGAVHLDQVRPGWAWEIDPYTFDIAHPCRCVFALLFGSYAHGFMTLPADREGFRQGWAYGFDINHAWYAGVVAAENAYRMLHDAWIEAIADRLFP